MPGMPAADAARHIREVSPKSGIVVLTMDESPQTMLQMFRKDIRGYVFKSDLESDLHAAIPAVAGGIHLKSTEVGAAGSAASRRLKLSFAPRLLPEFPADLRKNAP